MKSIWVKGRRKGARGGGDSVENMAEVKVPRAAVGVKGLGRRGRGLGRE